MVKKTHSSNHENHTPPLSRRVGPPPFSPSALSSLSPSDIQIKITTAPRDPAPRATIHLTDAQPHGQFLRATITNDTPQTISLRRLTLSLPFPRPAADTALICVGAWEMGRNNVRVHPASTTEKLETGSYLLARSPAGSTIAAFVTWKTFHSKLRWEADTLFIDADAEGRHLKPGETLQTEKVWLASAPASAGGTTSVSSAWQDLLFAYADLIATENNIHLPPPKPRIGWATWDYYGRDWTHAQVAANIEKLSQILPASSPAAANFIQIDAGWWPLRGDYTQLKPHLRPDGMKRIADLARSKNYDAGIHLDGWRADVTSDIARAHPDWFLRDTRGKHIVQPKTRESEGNFVFFDYSHPAACDYIKRVLHHIRRDWGYTYFKMDFIRHGTNEYILHDSRSKATIAPHDPSLTSIERTHRSLAAMREGMGPDAYFLGSSAVYGPAYGHVDALRTSGDISPTLRGFKRCALNNVSNFYLHNKVVHNDADYHVARAAPDQDAHAKKDGANLTLNEAWLWTHYIALCGGPRLHSDDLLLLRPERLALFQFAASFPTAERFVPLDLFDHARDAGDPPAVILTTAKGDCYLGLFNWTDTEKTITLTGLTPAQLAKLAKISGDAAIVQAAVMKIQGVLTVTLPPRHSTILKLPATDFDQLRRAIDVK